MRRGAFTRLAVKALSAVLLAAAVFAPTAGAQESGIRPPTDESYSAALQDLEARRYGSAIERLGAIVSRDPGNLGALLDLAIAHCLVDEPDAAARIFLALESRSDLPPTIAEVVAYYRSGGCRPGSVGLQGFASLGAGYARNLNLAPLSGLISLPGLGIDLPLAASSRPRNAPFSQLEAGAVYPLTLDEEWTLGAFAQGLHYAGESNYDLASVQASLNFRRTDPSLQSEAQLAYARLWLGGTAHLSATVANGAVLTPLDSRWSAGPALTASFLSYTELSAFDARQLELRGRLRWQMARSRVTLDAGWLHDAQIANRPGGDRRGPVLTLRANWLPGEADAVDLAVRQAWLNDSEPYNPPLFGDARRSTRLTSLQAIWRHALGPRLSARFEYRYQLTRDTIELFAYDAHTASVSLEWSFSR